MELNLISKDELLVILKPILDRLTGIETILAATPPPVVIPPPPPVVIPPPPVTTPPLVIPDGHPASGIFDVGVGQPYTSLDTFYYQQIPGDVIRIHGELKGYANTSSFGGDKNPGNYMPITIEGVDGGKINGLGDAIRWDQALLIVEAEKSLIVQNLELTGAQSNSYNGAGIRGSAGGKKLVVKNCNIHDNEDGILSEVDQLEIYDSTFDKNGINDQTHNLYVQTAAKSVVISNSSFSRANGGACIKSRAPVNILTKVKAFDGDVPGSYNVDAPNGGSWAITNCIFQQTPGDNRHMFSFGTEVSPAPTDRVHKMVFRNCIIINDSDASWLFRLGDWVTQDMIDIKNCVIVGSFQFLFDQMGKDNGWKFDPSNKIFKDRASAGYPAFAALPPFMV